MEKSKWKGTFGRVIRRKEKSSPLESSSESREVKMRPKKMSLGILSDKETDEVPGKLGQLKYLKHRVLSLNGTGWD